MDASAALGSLPGDLTENNYSEFVPVGITCIVVNTIIFALYQASRSIYGSHDRLEAWTLVPLAYLCAISLTCTGFICHTIGGWGHHMVYNVLIYDDFLTNTLEKLLKIQVAIEVLYVCSIALSKLILLTLYLRVFPTRTIRLLTWAIIVGVVGFWVAGIIVTFTICTPVDYTWDRSIPDGSCSGDMDAFRYYSVPNILFDIAIAILPVVPLWKLQISTPKKVGLFVTFLLGSLGIVAAILRFHGFLTVNFHADLTFYGVRLLNFTVLEASAYFVCACLPGIRPLFSAMCQKAGITSTVERTATMLSSSSRRTRDRSCRGDGTIGLIEYTRTVTVSEEQRCVSPMNSKAAEVLGALPQRTEWV